MTDCCKTEMASVATARSRKQNLVLSKIYCHQFHHRNCSICHLFQQPAASPAHSSAIFEEFCRLIYKFFYDKRPYQRVLGKSGIPFHQRPKERLPIAVKFSREIPDLSCWLICQGLQEVFWETGLPFSHLFHHICSF